MMEGINWKDWFFLNEFSKLGSSNNFKLVELYLAHNNAWTNCNNWNQHGASNIKALKNWQIGMLWSQQQWKIVSR